MATVHVPAGKEMRIVGPAKLNMVARFEKVFTQTNFTLQNPPTLGSIAPNTAVHGTGADLICTVTGTNFLQGISGVIFNGSPVATTWVSATSMTFQVRPSTFISAGAVPVLVQTYTHQTAPQNFTFT